MLLVVEQQESKSNGNNDNNVNRCCNSWRQKCDQERS